MGERFELAKIALLALSDQELARIEEAIPCMRRVVRIFEDQETAAGLADLDSEPDVQSTLAELDKDLEQLLGRDND